MNCQGFEVVDRNLADITFYCVFFRAVAVTSSCNYML